MKPKTTQLMRDVGADLRMGSGEPISIRGGEYFEDLVQLEVPLYLQTNPKWAEDKIGSGEKMKNVGCTVCSVAMAFSYHGINTSPKDLNNYLLDNKGYNSRGWLRWQKCAEFSGGAMKLSYVGNPSYEIIDDNLKQGNPVIVKVFISLYGDTPFLEEKLDALGLFG